MDENERKALITEWVRAYRDRLLRVCFLNIRDIALAEDAVQEAYTRAYHALDKFRGDSAPFTWLVRIAVNCCRDIQRSNRHGLMELKLAPDTLANVLGGDKAPEDIAVTLAVMKLPQKLREVITLYYYQGYNTREIAQIVRATQSTVARRLKKARALLYAELTEE